jgi:hypothetical protein
LLRSAVLLAVVTILGATGTAAASRGRAPARRAESVLALGQLSETSWLIAGLSRPRGQTFELTPEPWRAFLERYLEPWRNHTPEWRSFYGGAYGPARRAWLPTLCWSNEACSTSPAEPQGPGLESLELRAPLAIEGTFTTAPAGAAGFLDAQGPEPELLAVATRRPCPSWRAPRPVTVLRYAGEMERIALTNCSGAIDTDALDRLSVLARPAGVARPPLPLPIDPEGEAGEWTNQVRLLNPRLVWVVSELARAFPGHAIVFMSGYRREAHSGLHGKAQALDLYVRDVPNEMLFAVCRQLRDAGCGFYPNNHFVHVDVRPFGIGRVAWVDVSGPGEPSRYVDGWPDVLAPGIGWLGGE